MRRPTVVLFLFLFSLPALLAAAEPAAAEGSHEQAARELFEMVGGKTLTRTAGLAMIEALARNPEMAAYEDIFKSWIDKVYTGSDLEKAFVRLYTEAFSEDELRQMIAFYRTPVGQKALQKMPELMQKGIEYGQKMAEEHLPELQAAIAARKRELEAKAGEPKPPQ